MYPILALFFAIVIATFSIQNATPVNLKFLWLHFDNISLVLVILLSAIFGALVIYCIYLFKTFTLKRELGSIKKEKSFLEKELHKFIEAAPTSTKTENTVLDNPESSKSR